MLLAEPPNLIPALPELFLALIVMVSVVLGVFQKGGVNEINVKVFRVVFWLSIISIFLGLPGFVISRARTLLEIIEPKLNLAFAFFIGEKNSILSELKVSFIPYFIAR